MQVIAVQPDIVWEDKAANFERVRKQLASAAVAPGALIVLPEMFATGFSMNVAGIAEGADGSTHEFLVSLAKEHQATVIGGVVTLALDGRGLNQAVVFGPDGTSLARYSKIHPFSFAGETNHYVGGNEIGSFVWQELPVAPFVCYDLRFPEIFRHATRKGAELLVVIANWPEARDSHWQALLRARAIENQAFLVGVNRVGSDPLVRYAGHSLILSPKGETLAAGGSEPEVLTAVLERQSLLDYRQKFPALKDIRGEFLGGT
jgi:predicted amidohydrolase